MNRIVDGIVETTALLAFYRHAGDEITHVDHVAELAEFLAYLYTLEEVFCLFVEKIETVPCSFQTEVTAHDTYIVAHAFANLFHALSNQPLLFVGQSTFIVPCWYLLVEVVLIYMFNTVLGSSLGINHSLDERVAGKTVAAMQTGA